MSNYFGANPLWLDLIPIDGGGVEDGISTLAIGLGVGIVAVIVIAMVYLFIRKKGGKEEEKDVRLP
jgi:hypothetical protein